MTHAAAAGDPRGRGRTKRAAVRRRVAKLPCRQRQVLDQLVAGRSPKEVARALGIRWNTVRNHISKLRARFEARTTLELVVLVVDSMAEEGPHGS